MRRVQSTLFALIAASNAAYADTTINLTKGVSPISHDVYQLHMTLFWIVCVIGAVVFGVMFYSIVHHRKSRGVKPAEFHTHPVLEVTWTIVPAIILILMAIPATKVLFNMGSTEQDDITIKITGYQWKWHYEYIEDDIKFFSSLSTPIDQMQNKAPKGKYYLREVDHPLVVPIHKKIRFLVTSNDVNHAWWVPDLAVKRDAIAGFINEAWTIIDKPGTYRGQCAELCGINHAFMPIVVVATTEQGYKDWVAKQKGQATAGEADTLRKWTKKELMTHGEQIYKKICAACHQPNGQGLPPTFPALKGSKIAIGPIKDHLNIVFNGKTGTAMQAFKNQLSDIDIASVITYERHSWGNNADPLLQPIQVKALRDGMTMDKALAVVPSAKGVVKPAKKEDKKADKKEVKQEAVKPLVKPAEKKKVVALSPKEELKEAMKRGKEVYMSTCAVCHQPEGQGVPPVFPALKGSKVATGPKAGHIDRVLHGKKGTAMQAFMYQMDDQKLADVITYERNAWGNNMGDLIKPEEVKAARKK